MIHIRHVRAPKLVLIGGGTGSFTLLQGLKEVTPNLSAIVSMSDDGGSAGRLRDEFGVLPPGDIRQCLVALSGLPEARRLFSYRFGGDGPLSGHTFGNLFLTAAEKLYEDDKDEAAENKTAFERGLELASELLNIAGAVIPITLEKHRLVLHDGNKIVVGEDTIDHYTITHPEPWLSLDPPAKLYAPAATAIQEADLIVIAPGSLYGSIISVLAVEGVPEALAASHAKKVMVCNLINKPGQTDGWHVVNYVKAVEHYIGEGQIDSVLYNQDLPSQELLSKYAAEGEFPVKTEAERFSEVTARPLGASLVASTIATQDPNDKAVKRTLIRHDAYQVSKQLMDIFYE